MNPIYIDELDVDWIKLVASRRGKPDVAVRSISRMLTEFRYSDDQERDENGRWSGEGGWSASKVGNGEVVLGHARMSKPAFEQWVSYVGATYLRYAAEQVLGHPHIPGITTAEAHLQEGIGEAIKTMHQIGIDSPFTIEGDATTARVTLENATGLLEGIADAPAYGSTLWRGVQADTQSAEGLALLALRAGDRFDVALTSTTPQREIAEGFANQTWIGKSRGDHVTVPVIIELSPSTKGLAAPVSYDHPRGPEPADVFRDERESIPFEVVTSGRFTVTEVTTNDLQWTVIKVEQVGVFDPVTGELRSTSNRYRRALFAALLDGSMRRLGSLRSILRILGELRYSDDQARDEHGMWTTDGGSGSFTMGGGTLDVMAGTHTVGGQRVAAHLVGLDSQPVQLSVAGIAGIAGMSDGTKADGMSAYDLTLRVSGVVERLEGGVVPGHTVDDIPANLSRVADSVLARYAADEADGLASNDPEWVSLQQQDEFYQQWHYTTETLATETGITQDRVAAAMSAISPNKQAPVNLREGTDLARMIADNPAIGNRAVDYADSLQRAGNLKLAEGTTKATEAAIPLLYAADEIAAGRMTNLNDLPGYPAALVSSWMRSESGPIGDVPLLHSTPDAYRTVTAEKGWQAGKYGFADYAKAIDVLRGYDVVPPAGTVDNDGQRRWANQYGSGYVGERTAFGVEDALQGVKTRSFVNNILDPADTFGTGSVTVDFQMIDAAFWKTQAADTDRDTAWDGNPSVDSVQVGTRAHIADAIRDLVPRFSEALGEPVTASDVQQALWAEFKRMDTTDPPLLVIVGKPTARS